MIKLKQIISELGEATLKPFEYELHWSTSRLCMYKIKIFKNVNIDLNLNIIDIPNYKKKYKKYFPSYFIENMPENEKILYNYDILFNLDFTTNVKYELEKNKQFKWNDSSISFQEGFLSLKDTLRLMTTIVVIIKEFIKSKIKHKYFYFSFEPYKSKASPTGREHLYMAYLKKNLPSDWVIEKTKLDTDDVIYFYPKITK